jgi:hypothetical protein
MLLPALCFGREPRSSSAGGRRPSPLPPPRVSACTSSTHDGCVRANSSPVCALRRVAVMSPACWAVCCCRAAALGLVQGMDHFFNEAQRQGRISFYMQSSGEEAIHFGTASCLRDGECGVSLPPFTRTSRSSMSYHPPPAHPPTHPPPQLHLSPLTSGCHCRRRRLCPVPRGGCAHVARLHRGQLR